MLLFAITNLLPSPIENTHKWCILIEQNSQETGIIIKSRQFSCDETVLYNCILTLTCGIVKSFCDDLCVQGSTSEITNFLIRMRHFGRRLLHLNMHFVTIYCRWHDSRDQCQTYTAPACLSWTGGSCSQCGKVSCKVHSIDCLLIREIP